MIIKVYLDIKLVNRCRWTFTTLIIHDNEALLSQATVRESSSDILCTGILSVSIKMFLFHHCCFGNDIFLSSTLASKTDEIRQYLDSQSAVGPKYVHCCCRIKVMFDDVRNANVKHE